MNRLAVAHSVTKALNQALQKPSQTEPQLVANLVWHIAKEINQLGFAKAAGVFVHGQPHVSCTSFPAPKPKSVELGDLLLLCSHRDPQGRLKNRRGLLLQAKKSDRIPAQPDNPNQHHLYAAWPEFVYERKIGALKNQKRKLEGVDLSNASQYLLIPDDGIHFDSPFCWHSWPYHFLGLDCRALVAHATLPELSHHHCFAATLTAFILGDAGKTYDDPPVSTDKGWSRVIQDLLTVTGTQASTYIKRASGGGHAGRLCFLAGILPTGGALQTSFTNDDHRLLEKIAPLNDGPPEIPKEGPSSDDDTDGGISILEFIVEEQRD